MRFLVIVARLLPLALSFVRDHRRWLAWGGPVARSAAFHERRAERVVATLAGLGPTFVKLAQLFAGRADLIPEPYVSTLARLVDQVPPVPLARIRATIEAEYGAPVEQVFEAFEPEPIAAASLGQVHRARVDGAAVAVKVLRPGVERLVDEDVRAADRILAMVERRWPNPHVRGLRSVVQEFARRVGDEMDFRLEAANAREIRRNFAGTPGVLVPRVHDELVRQRVLVLELMEGERIDRWMAAARERANARRAGASGRGAPVPDEAGAVLAHVIELYMRMMLVDGLFHADPHPGNLLVAPDGSLVLLDFGMVVRVPRAQRWQLVQTVFAAIRRDADGVVAGFQALGVVEPGASLAVVRELVVTLLALADQYTTVPERMELLANEVMSTMYDWPVVLPPDLVYFARTAALIEGLGVRYDPRFNAIAFASPIAIRMRHEIVRSLREDAEAVGAPDPVGVGGLLGALLGEGAMGKLGELAARVLAVPGVSDGVAAVVRAWRGDGARGAPPAGTIPPDHHLPATHPSHAGPDDRTPASALLPGDPIATAAALAGGVLGIGVGLARRAAAVLADAAEAVERELVRPPGREPGPPSRSGNGTRARRIPVVHARVLEDDDAREAAEVTVLPESVEPAALD